MIARIERAIRSRPRRVAPDDGAPARAAVALIFREVDVASVELLFIRRAERSGDPWSGQIGLPGGRWSPNDESLVATALRETREEIGVDLSRQGRILGCLDDLRPRTPTLPPIIVTPFVTELTQPPTLVLSEEVADAFWIPWQTLADPQTTRETEVTVRGSIWRVPALVVGPHVVWGMTERIIRQLLHAVADHNQP